MISAPWPWLAIALLAACDNNSAPRVDPPPHATSATCRDVATREVASTGLLGDQKTRVARNIASRCHDDRWSIAVRRCILASQGSGEIDTCHDMLTAAQRDAYRRDIDGSADDH